RTIVYIGTYMIFLMAFKKRSRQEDLEGGTRIHFINYKKGALFLVFFAVFSSTQAWDWLMSLDTHWYSTLFGWYTFAGMWVSAIIVFIMITLYLKSKDKLEHVNESHLHDLGKWMFAISFLWSYLFFFQYMLIWYANVPEEITYYQFRYENYKAIYWIMFVINFTLPMVILMSRDAKRNPKILIGIGSIIFVGHWLDVFVMVMPATMFKNWQFSWMEIGMFLLFLGAFIFVVLRALSKQPLSVKHHPYLEESMNHHT
ncbi:MAG TPA: quinol:cytochrome C oxidoreductase, partial [Flavobacteriales bacterium]|nr:quinol:cytochrome C oxidoreductase [Flavobacteriales bacterium]